MIILYICNEIWSPVTIFPLFLLPLPFVYTLFPNNLLAPITYFTSVGPTSIQSNKGHLPFKAENYSDLFPAPMIITSFDEKR